MQNVISVVVAVDKDEDFLLDDEEADELIVRVKSCLKLASIVIHLDEEKFRKVIENNNLSGIIEIINKNIRRKSLPEEHKILVFPPKKR